MDAFSFHYIIYGKKLQVQTGEKFRCRHFPAGLPRKTGRGGLFVKESRKNRQKGLTNAEVCVYNKGCISAAAAFCVRGGSKIASATKESEVQKDAQNIPAEKAPQKNGARLQKENGDGQRQKGIEAQKSQRQTQAQLLSPCSERHKARKAEPFRLRGDPNRENGCARTSGAKVTTMEKQKKPHVLKENRLFAKTYARGKCFSSRTVVLYALRSRGRPSPTRVGLTVSKSRGNAVVRNRTRRRLREALRPVYPLVKDGFLIVLVARQAAVEAPFADISADLRHVLQRAALLRDGSA